jgi:hypothetical protein
MVWRIVCRRLESLLNINASQLFDELCIQFPNRFTPRQYKTLLRRVTVWRREARARVVAIGPRTYRDHPGSHAWPAIPDTGSVQSNSSGARSINHARCADSSVSANGRRQYPLHCASRRQSRTALPSAPNVRAICDIDCPSGRIWRSSSHRPALREAI